MIRRAENPKPAPQIQSLLSRLRWGIRLYVWLEGAALAVVWLVATFWLILAIDYLPVRLAADELSWRVRAVLLALVVGVLLFVVYRWIIRRTLMPLADHSLALVLERRYRQFHDSLVTCVELAEQPERAEPFNPELLQHTERQALARLGEVRPRQVFNFWPLAVRGSLALLLAASVGLLGLLAPGHLLLAAARIYLLDDHPWPRRADIEVMGIEVQRSSVVPIPVEGPKLIAFQQGQVKVAKGASVVLKVRADATGPQRVVPETCTILYRTAEGDRGRQYMSRVGRVNNGMQLYSFDGKPFKGILSSIRFDVLGYDDRVRDLQLVVVDEPAVVATELDCVFPDYMVDPESTAWTPRTIAWTSGTQLPMGTQITLRVRSSKPLRRAYVHFPAERRTETVRPTAGAPDMFELPLPALQDSVAMEITLHDVDDVISQSPQRLYITAVPDEAPQVDVALRGIGVAVTPDVRVPIEGTIRDDYGVARAWVEVVPPEHDVYEHPVVLGRAGRVSAAIDFRRLRDDSQRGLVLKPGPDQKLILTVKAADRYDLSGPPHVGSGDRYELDIVTPDQLLAILEREEAGLRRRVEQIRDEMTEARDYLLRVKSGLVMDSAAGAEPGDAASDQSAPDAERLLALRALLAQRALLQTRKSAQEVLGTADAFRNIRQQLINNRIDAEDRKSRLKNDVVDPLQYIGGELMAALESRLERLETQLKRSEKKQPDPEADKQIDQTAAQAVAQADAVLTELEKVLEKLIKFETYAELLDIVRDLIEDQDRIIEETKKRRKKDVLEGLIQ